LLLFLGVTIPTVLFLLWGVMEIASIPLAKIAWHFIGAAASTETAQSQEQPREIATRATVWLRIAKVHAWGGTAIGNMGTSARA
jgi:hypothetical protein